MKTVTKYSESTEILRYECQYILWNMLLQYELLDCALKKKLDLSRSNGICIS